MSLEQAEAAFDTALGNNAEVAKSGTTQVGIEQIFPTREHENDVEAGGDDLPNPIKRRKEPVQAAVEGQDDDPEAFLYADLDDEPNPDEDDDDTGLDDGEDEDENEEDEDEEEGEVLEALPANVAKLRVKVIADGEEMDVPLSEAVLGYQRTEVFHRRLNRLTEVAHEVETAATEVVAERTKAVELIDQLGTQLAEFLPTEPNWDEQFKLDAPKARKLQKDYELLKGKLTELATKRADLVAQNERDNAKRLQKFIVTEKAKVETKNPHWSDPKKKARDLSSMARTLRAEGFTDDEIKTLYDSRMISIVLKASKFDRMTAKRPVPSQRGKQPIKKPGAGRVRTAPKALESSQRQLSRTGRVEDAASVFQHIIK